MCRASRIAGNPQPAVVGKQLFLLTRHDMHIVFVLQGNPFCLQSDYLQLVQTSLHTLQYFDGNKVSWPTTSAAAQPTDAAIDSSAISKAETGPSHRHPKLQLVVSQLSVPNTVPGRLPSPDAANEPSPPLYYYYLQLCTADGTVAGGPGCRACHSQQESSQKGACSRQRVQG